MKEKGERVHAVNKERPICPRCNSASTFYVRKEDRFWCQRCGLEWRKDGDNITILEKKPIQPKKKDDDGAAGSPMIEVKV